MASLGGMVAERAMLPPTANTGTIITR
jgi:hypothetical protein